MTTAHVFCEGVVCVVHSLDPNYELAYVGPTANGNWTVEGRLDPYNYEFVTPGQGLNLSAWDWGTFDPYSQDGWGITDEPFPGMENWYQYSCYYWPWLWQGC